MENRGYSIYEVGNLGGNDQDEWNLFHSFVLSEISIIWLKIRVYLEIIKRYLVIYILEKFICFMLYVSHLRDNSAYMLPVNMHLT